MVHRSRARSSSLFLMELIIAILFFSVASAVCVEFFVKSHLMSRGSEALTHAVNECSGTDEIICTAKSMAEGVYRLQQQYPEGDYPNMEESADLETGEDVTATEMVYKEADVRIYYDGDFMPCGRENSEYILEIHLTEEKQMIGADFEMRDGDDAGDAETPVYQMSTKHHIARGTGYHEG